MAGDVVNYDLGVDLKSSMDFVDGDLSLVKYDENLCQGVINRLNTNLDELDLFYDDYGSVLSSFFGWKRLDENLPFIKMEVEKVLSEEPRLESFNVSVNYGENGELEIHLSLYPDLSDKIEMNLVLSDENEIVDVEYYEE